MHAQGLIVFALYYVVTSGALLGLHAYSADPSRLLEVLVLVLSSVVGTALRFVLLRSWVYSRDGGPGGGTAASRDRQKSQDAGLPINSGGGTNARRRGKLINDGGSTAVSHEHEFKESTIHAHGHQTPCTDTTLIADLNIV